jgi:hypothetical protein
VASKITGFGWTGRDASGKEGLMKLSVKGFFLAGGILWAASVFIMTLMAMAGYGSMSGLMAIKCYYLGYRVSFFGGIVGAIWGFFDSGIACAIFAALYNKFAGE